MKTKIVRRRGNLWEFIKEHRVRAALFPVSGAYTREGKAILRGTEYGESAESRWPQIGIILGQTLKAFGFNRPVSVGALKDGEHTWPWSPLVAHQTELITFPIKRKTHDKADMSIISKSAFNVAKWRTLEGKTIVLAEPGEGEGVVWQQLLRVLKRSFRRSKIKKVIVLAELF